jgi:hypothetical protein
MQLITIQFNLGNVVYLIACHIYRMHKIHFINHLSYTLLRLYLLRASAPATESLNYLSH